MSKTVIQNLFKRINNRKYKIPDIPELKIMGDTNDTSDIEVLFFNRNGEEGIIKIFQEPKTQTELNSEKKKLRLDENYGNDIYIIFVLNKSSARIGFDDENIEIFEINDLQYDIMESSSMSTDVHIFNEKERKKFLDKNPNYINPNGSCNLQKIKENDPLSKYYGMKKGDICRYKKRNSIVSTYQICVE